MSQWNVNKPLSHKLNPPEEEGSGLDSAVNDPPDFINQDIHRIHRDIVYDGILRDVYVNDQNNVVPPRTDECVIGVSFFLPTEEFFQLAHKSFGDFKKLGCGLYGGEIPSGIKVIQDRPLRRKNSSRVMKDMGQHFSLYPTVEMSRSSFEEKIAKLRRQFICSAKAEADGKSLMPSPPPPSFPADPLLRQASFVLYELAVKGTYPDRVIRTFYFHYLLAEPDAEYGWLLRGDALSYYTALALDEAATASMNEEELRDEIRDALSERIQYNPVFRSYPDDYFEPTHQHSIMTVFGEFMPCPQPDGEDFGDFNDEQDAGGVPSTWAVPALERVDDVRVTEIRDFIRVIMQKGLTQRFLDAVNSLPANSGIDTPLLKDLMAQKCSHTVDWTSEEVIFLNSLDRMKPDSRIEVGVHSLALRFEIVSPEHGNTFVNLLNNSSSYLPNLFLAVVACVRKRSLASTHFLSSRIMDEYRFVESGKRGNAVFVDIFQPELYPPQTNLEDVCTAINKCIKCFKRTVWQLRRRVIVMCLSSSLSIDLMRVNPGIGARDVEMRTRLQETLASCPGFPKPSGLVFGPCGQMVRFLVFSYGESLHNLTSEVAQDCFKQLQIEVGKPTRMFVTV